MTRTDVFTVWDFNGPITDDSIIPRRGARSYAMITITAEDREQSRYGYLDKTGERIVIGSKTIVPSGSAIYSLKPLSSPVVKIGSTKSETVQDAIEVEPRDILDELDEAYRGFGDYLLAKRAADEIRRLRAELVAIKTDEEARVDDEYYNRGRN